MKVPELMDLTSDYRNVFTANDFSTLLSSGRAFTEIIKNETNNVSKGKNFTFLLEKYDKNVILYGTLHRLL